MAPKKSSGRKLSMRPVNSGSIEFAAPTGGDETRRGGLKLARRLQPASPIVLKSD